MGGWPVMIETPKMHGGGLFCLRQMERKVARTFSYHWHGLLFNPYKVHMIWRYVFGGVMGQSLGGRNTYVLPSGKHA